MIFRTFGRKNKRLKLKLFQTTQKNLAEFGFKKNHSILNAQHVRNTFTSSLTITLQFLYVYYEAKSVEEYMLCIFMILMTTGILMNHLITILKTKLLFNLIDDFQNLANESEWFFSEMWKFECKTIHTFLGSSKSTSKSKLNDANELVEILSKIIYFLVVYVCVPVFVLPKAALCIFMYLTSDSGSDVLELPLPIWWNFSFSNWIFFSSFNFALSVNPKVSVWLEQSF